MAHIPYGYKIVNGSAVIDPEEKEKILKLCGAYLSGATYRDCRGISGIPRTPKGCKAILLDDTYLGNDFYPRLIPAELFGRVRDEYERRPKGRGGRKKRRPISVRTEFRFNPPPGERIEEDPETADPWRKLSALYGYILPVSEPLTNDTS